MKSQNAWCSEEIHVHATNQGGGPRGQDMGHVAVYGHGGMGGGVFAFLPHSLWETFPLSPVLVWGEHFSQWWCVRWKVRFQISANSPISAPREREGGWIMLAREPTLLVKTKLTAALLGQRSEWSEWGRWESSLVIHSRYVSTSHTMSSRNCSRARGEQLFPGTGMWKAGLQTKKWASSFWLELSGLRDDKGIENAFNKKLPCG